MDPSQKMLELVSGHWVSQAIKAAAELGVADQLKDGPKDFQDLAKAVDAHPQSLCRLLRALAGIGIFEETEKGVFELTPLAELLRTDAKPSLKGIALLHGSDDEYFCWGNILHSVRTGESAFKKTWGKEIFDHFKDKPTNAAIFDNGMNCYSDLESPAVAAAFDFSSFESLMDVGGGQGHLLSTILQANPSLKGVLVDLPHVADRAVKFLDPLKDRCKIVPGSFFEELPTGSDAIIMKSILHDWSKKEQTHLLLRCHAALPASGKLLAVERVLPAGNVNHRSKWMDLNMLVQAPGGYESTAEEYGELLSETGFSLVGVVPVPGTDMSIIEAVKS